MFDNIVNVVVFIDYQLLILVLILDIFLFKMFTQVSDNTRLRSFINQFDNKVISTNTAVLFCKICDVKVLVDKF